MKKVSDTTPTSTQAERLAIVEGLYQQHHDYLLRFLARMSIDGLEIKDIAQEAYCRLFKMDNLGAINNPRAFLFRTAVNLVNDHLRQTYRRSSKEHVDIDSVELHTGDPLIEQIVQGKQELDIMRRTLDELSPKCLAVFILCRIEGHTQKEAAAEINISTSMVEKYMFQALSRFKQRLGQARKPALELVKPLHSPVSRSAKANRNKAKINRVKDNENGKP